jgi:hypothetical protein
MCVEKRLELRFGYRAHLLGGNGPVLEKQQSRNAANVVLRRRFRILVDIELYDLQSVRVLVCDGVQNWSDHFAGAAPFGPEVEKHRPARFYDILLERRIGRMYDLSTHVIYPLIPSSPWTHSGVGDEVRKKTPE